MKIKSNTVVQTSWDETGNIMTAAVVGCEDVILFDRRKASVAMRARAERHGWEQRLRDRAAIGRETKDGTPAAPAEKHAAIKAIAAHYETGGDQWRLTGERKPVDTDALLNALCALNPGLSKDALKAMVDKAKGEMENA